MKKIYYFLFLIVLCLSCERENKNSIFTDVTLYYYGYSGMGYTYEVPVRFFTGGKEVAFFILYSTDKDLKTGVYNYNEKIVYDADYNNNYITCTNFTFFKGKCRWGDINIKAGSVTVERNNDDYSFIIDVVDNKGDTHKGKYQGKVKKQNFARQSEIGGVFAVLHLTNANNQWERPVGLPDDYAGGLTMLQVEAGEKNEAYVVNIMYLHPDENDPTGTYYINPNANYYYQEGENVYQNYCYYSLAPQNFTSLVSGSITITRVNKPYKFKIDVDVTDRKGGQIQGCFDGIDYWGDY
jgi:hypothetical protein